MKENCYRKTLRGIITVGLIAVLAVSMFSLAFADDTEIENLDEFIASQKKCASLTGSMGMNSLYAQWRSKTECQKILGVNENQAMDTAATELIEDIALQKVAAEEGFTVTDAETEEYMQSIMEDAKNDDAYAQICAACEKQGITFEETIKKNKNYYYMELLKGKLYKYHLKIKFGEDAQLSDEDIEKADQSWETFVSSVTDSYKKTSDYKSVASYLEEVKQSSQKTVKAAPAKSKDMDYIRY